MHSIGNAPHLTDSLNAVTVPAQAPGEAGRTAPRSTSPAQASSRLSLDIPAGQPALPCDLRHLLHLNCLELRLAAADGTDSIPPNLEYAQGIRHLILEGAQMTAQDWAVLASLRSLEKLELRGSNMQTGMPEWFNSDQFPRLTSLQIEAPSRDLQINFGALSGLRQLNVADFTSSEQQEQLWANVARLSDLREFQINDCELNSVPSTFNSVSHPHLNLLAIDGDHFTQLPVALIDLDADVILSNTFDMSQQEAVTAMSLRVQARLLGDISAGFSTTPVYGDAQMDIRSQLRDAWEARNGLSAGPAGMRARLPVDLTRLQDRVCEHVAHFLDIAASLGYEVSEEIDQAAMHMALVATQRDFALAHPTRVEELAGSAARVRLQQQALADMVEKISLTDMQEAESILNGHGGLGLQSSAARDPSVRTTPMVDWTSPAPAVRAIRASSLLSSSSSSTSHVTSVGGDPANAARRAELSALVGNSDWQKLHATDAQLHSSANMKLYLDGDDDHSPLLIVEAPAPHLQSMTMVTHLSFSNVAPANLHQVASLRALQSLCCEVPVNGAPFMMRDWEALRPLRELRQLYLSNVKEVPEWFNRSNFPHLNRIVLANSTFESVPPSLASFDADIELPNTAGMSNQIINAAAAQYKVALQRGETQATLRIEDFNPSRNESRKLSTACLERFQAAALLHASWQTVQPLDQTARPAALRAELKAICAKLNPYLVENVLTPRHGAARDDPQRVSFACIARALIFTQLDFENALPIEHAELAGQGARIEVQNKVIAHAASTFIDSQEVATEIAVMFNQDIPGIHSILADYGTDSESDLESSSDDDSELQSVVAEGSFAVGSAAAGDADSGRAARVREESESELESLQEATRRRRLDADGAAVAVGVEGQPSAVAGTDPS